MIVPATLTVGEQLITLRASYHSINAHLGLDGKTAGAQQAAMSMTLVPKADGSLELLWKPNLRGSVPSNTAGGQWTYDFIRRRYPELFSGKLKAGKYHINLEPRRTRLVGTLEMKHE